MLLCAIPVETRIYADRSLACRLEDAEALANARFVEARARLAPGSGAEWIEVAGAHAMFDGPRSPCTQTFGLGLFRMPAAADMDIIEEFFKVRAAPVMHEVCPLANKELLPLLSERGYRPLELSNVMFMQLANPPDMSRVSDSNLRVRIMDAHESETWAQTAAAGWSEFAGIADLMLDLMRVSAAREDGACFLVEADGQPIATGGLALHDGVALFAGASTIPEWRRRGAQQLLFQSRYQYAIDAGCDIAMVSTEPGSASQRNAERQGFRVAYTRTKWHLAT